MSGEDIAGDMDKGEADACMLPTWAGGSGRRARYGEALYYSVESLWWPADDVAGVWEGRWQRGVCCGRMG